jgi:hypothetical protein
MHSSSTNQNYPLALLPELYDWLNIGTITSVNHNIIAAATDSQPELLFQHISKYSNLQ